MTARIKVLKRSVSVKKSKMIRTVVYLAKYSKVHLFKLLLLLFWVKGSYAQDSIVIQGSFRGNTTFARVVLSQYALGTVPIADAVINNEHFILKLPSNVEPGVYRLQYAFAAGEQFLDIIINGAENEINFSLAANEPSAVPNFIVSDENRKWYSYLDKKTKLLQKISLLNQLINVYPDGKAQVIKMAYRDLKVLKSEYDQSLSDFSKNMQGSWAYEMVRNRPDYFSNPKNVMRIQEYEIHQHYWDGIVTNDPKLMNTPLYTEHILNYLRYWMNPDYNFSPLERTQGFKQGCDVILKQFSGNNQTLEFAYRYLSLGFKEIGEEEVLQYLDEKYKHLAIQCYDENEKSAFEKRMLGYEAMKPGSTAPNFIFEDAGFNFYELKAQQSIIVFWASWCPHCMEELPKVNEWAGRHSEIKVIAISLDEDRAAYNSSIQKYPNLTFLCDFKKWDTPAAQEYFVYGTPSFILVDKDKKIMGKYTSWDSVEKMVNNK